MYLRSILLGGAVALHASAMLVVPDMGPEIDDEDAFTSMHPVVLQNAHHSLLDVRCNDCPFREVSENGDVSWTAGQSSSLVRHISMHRYAADHF